MKIWYSEFLIPRSSSSSSSSSPWFLDTLKEFCRTKFEELSQCQLSVKTSNKIVCLSFYQIKTNPLVEAYLPYLSYSMRQYGNVMININITQRGNIKSNVIWRSRNENATKVLLEGNGKGNSLHVMTVINIILK